MFTLKKLSTLLIAVFLGLLLVSCSSQKPIKIGFAGELTGKQIGIGARNGAQLAVETVNVNGGIAGRQLELLIKDDHGRPEVARQVDAKLVDAGVVAIIGHITSGQTAAVFEQMNEANVVLLSPASASTRFSNQQDYFFRVTSASDVVGSALAQYAYHSMKLRQVSGIYDTDNAAFSETFWEAFVTQFEALGGEVEQGFAYSSREDDLAVFAQDVLVTAPTAVVLISSPLDTALLAQHLRSSERKKTLLSSPWGFSGQLLMKGGQAVEGMIFSTTYDTNNPNPPFQAFVSAFRERFGHEPEIRAVYGYEAVQVLAEALRQTNGEADGLPEALTNIKEFPVIQGNLSMNEYGDVRRDVYITVVKDGQYHVVETISTD